MLSRKEISNRYRTNNLEHVRKQQRESMAKLRKDPVWIAKKRTPAALAKRRAYEKEYRSKNKKHAKAQGRAWREANIGSSHDASPTLDRVNSNRGYVRGNVAVISNRANGLKSNGTSDQHRRIANWMDEFLAAQPKRGNK